MKWWRLFIFVIVICGVAATAGPFRSARAAEEGINLQISPLPIDLNTTPGQRISTDLRVRNAGVGKERLKVRLLQVKEDDEGLVHLKEADQRDEYYPWISFSRNVFDAPSNEWQDIKMNIDVPKSAAFGYYFAVEFLREKEQETQPNKAVAKGAVATFILLNVDAPGAKRTAEVTAFIADHKFYEYLPANFRVKVRASGNVHVAPRGNIFIQKSGRDHDEATLEVNKELGNILPNSSRFFVATWDDGFLRYVDKTDKDGKPVLDKKGNPVKRVQWDWSKLSKFRFGRYTAKLLLIYDDGQRDIPIEGKLDFFLIPWRLILVAMMIVLVVLLGIYANLRSAWRRVRRR